MKQESNHDDIQDGLESLRAALNGESDPHWTLEQQLDAAHRANGRLVAELEELRQRHAALRIQLRESEHAYSEKSSRVFELEGSGAENRLKELAGKIESEQQRLDKLVERKVCSQGRIRQLQSLVEKFVTQAIDITDDIG